MMHVITNNSYDRTAATRLRVERAWVYRPQTAWFYSHHASLAFFQGRYYAIWSNGRRDEDAPGQRVLIACSEDFLNWSEPTPLLDTLPGEHSEQVLTAAGFHQHDGQLVAYAGTYEYRPECLDENGQRRPGDKGHMNTTLLAVTSRDGRNWSGPMDLGLPVVPNHGPQRTASGRLIISGNISFPYTDDPCGLRDWRMNGIYPESIAETVVDDSEGFWQVQAAAGWPNGLCEGAFYQNDDNMLHMLLRTNTERLWVTESRDDGVTWPPPQPTEFSDNATKFHCGRLPDGRFYYVGCPDPEPRWQRSPLVLSLSEDGKCFDCHYILADDSTPYGQCAAGMHKGGDYGYPHILLHDGCLHIIISRRKEAIEVLRVRDVAGASSSGIIINRKEKPEQDAPATHKIRSKMLRSLSEKTVMTTIIDWQAPETFNPETPGLGLPPLAGVEHTLLYDPLPSSCELDYEGDGRYESLRHGTYSHHQKIVLFEDKFIVYWTQHSRDENGPGQRVLAKVGTFNADRSDIAWGGDETLFEIAPAPVPVRRKHFEHDPNLIYETYAHGSLKLINGHLYMIGKLSACHGWTDDVQYHGFPGKPLPPEHWFDAADPEWWTRRKGVGCFDVWWDLGCDFVQEWRLENGRLVPASPLYKRSEPVTQVEVAVGRFKDVVPVTEPYASAIPFDQAPKAMCNDVLNGSPETFERMPKYAPGTWRLTADGTSGLAHHSEFRRPDGSWVAIRDNLCNPGYYYAAEKSHYADDYPLAVRTNLFGHAMPVAGELPDGRPWIVCNNESRHDMYLTLSEDGRTFDQTWLLLHNARGNTDGGMHKGGGPQYFQAITVGDNIWVVYSIAKEQVGVTRIPVSALPAPKNMKTRPNGTPVRHAWAAGTPEPSKPNAGFVKLDNVEHTLVYAGEREAGAYNHHSQLAWHNGALHAMWSNHPHGEDGPGQRVLYATSSDGKTWSKAVELFPPPQDVRPSEEKGLNLTATRWVVADSKLYAFAGCNANIGFENPDRTERVNVRDKEHPFRARKSHHGFFREVTGNGTEFGPILPQGENTPAADKLNFATLAWSEPAVQHTVAAIAEAMRNPERTPSWGGNYPQAVDSNRLCEPTVYKAADGKFVVLLRDDNYSHRMYISVSPDGRHWDPALPTDIPDSPGLTTSVRLDNGTVIIVGNFMASAFDNRDQIQHYGRDPLMLAFGNDGYMFDRAFTLRGGQQQWRTPQSEMHGRGGGGQYPSAIVQDGTLYVLYSMGKEDIWCSSVKNVAGASSSAGQTNS